MNVIMGTGPLGMSVMRELLQRGEQVKMVSYTGTANLPRGIQLEKVDLLDAEQASRSIKGAHKVYQCAQPPYQKWSELFMRMQDNIVAGAIASHTKLIVAENLYMYGFVKVNMHENLPYTATTKKGKLRAAMSDKLLNLHKDGLLQVTIGRGSDFFGPHVLGSVAGERFFKPILVGKACSILGNPDKKHTYTFIGDFGKALVTLGDHDDAFGQAWHVPNADAITTRQFADIAFRIAGFPTAIKSMGRGMLRIGGLFIPEAKESIEMFYQFENDFIVDSSKFSKRFNQQATSLETTIAETMEWFGKAF